MNRQANAFSGLSGKEGLTLIEVMTVLGIIGVMATIAFPMISNWLPNMRLKTAARDLYSNMQRIKMEAIKTNRDHAIVFDPALGRYHLCSDPGGDGVWSSTADNVILESVDLNQYKSGVGYGHGSVPAGNSATIPAGAFPSDEVSYNNNVLVFNQRGIGSGGYVYLQNPDNTAYAVGTQTSGVVLLRRWMGGVWK